MHTPGPWRLLGGTYIKARGHTLAQMVTGSTADARLILNAPELLATLHDAARALERLGQPTAYIHATIRKATL